MRTLAPVALVVLAACGSPPAPVTPPTAPAQPPAEAQPAPAAKLPDPAPPAFRLPGDVAPTAARLELTIVPDKADIPGHIGFDAKVLTATRVVWLSATDIQVTSATLGGIAARAIVDPANGFVGLTTDHELAPGPLAIEVSFVAHLDHEKSRGMYATAEEGSAAATYVYTFFEPTDARRAFPCFDEPAYKIPWTLAFDVRASDVALGNAPVESEHPTAAGMKRVTLVPSKPLPSYLVAFAVGPFAIVDDGTAGRAATPIRFVIPRGREDELGWAKMITPRIVAALEDYFDMPYPYVKLDVLVVPRYWGTMEHPGLLAMGQPLTLIRADQMTRERKEGYANIASHELSHYWFGDYVTLAWWNDTWLNEALGEFLDAIITDAIVPTWRYELLRVDRTRNAMSADETLVVQKIRQDVKSPQDIQASFDGAITYLKGSSVLRMFESSVGADKWRAFLRSYVRAHAWGNATADDLFAAVRAQLGADVERGLVSFIEQPGVPRIGMALDCTAAGGPALKLHQSRALPVGLVDPAPHTWTVPVCVRYGTATTASKACATLDAADGQLALAGACPTWIVPNANGAGYYRSALADIKLETELLTPGSAVARAAKPTPAERLMLISDLRAAVDRDELTIGEALALVPRVLADPDPRVAAAAQGLGGFRADGLDDALYARAIRYDIKLNKPLATRLGWKRKPGDDDDTQALRRLAVQAAHRDPALSAEATKLLARWFKDPKAIDDDMVDAVIGAAADHGDAALFAQLLERARNPRDRTEAERLISALGRFSDPAITDRALALTLDDKTFDLRDSIGIVYGAAFRRDTRAQALTFLEAHLDQLLARMREDEASWLLGGLAEMPCDKATRDRVAALVSPRAAKYSGAQAPVDRGLATADSCITSFGRQLPSLRAFLDKQ